MKKIQPLQGLHTPSVRLNNWTKIQKFLKKFEILIDADIKALIVAGDRELQYEILEEIFQKHRYLLKKEKRKGSKSNP